MRRAVKRRVNRQDHRQVNRRARVVHIISDTNLGGAGRYLLNLLGAFDRGQWELEVICPLNPVLATECQRLGIKVHVLPQLTGDCSFSWKNFRVLFGFLRSLHKEQPIDIVHTHATFAGRLAARLAGAQCVVYTRHRTDWEAPRRGWRGKVYRLLNRLTSDGVVAISGAVRDALREEGVPAERIALICNGIDAASFRARAEEEVRRLLSGSAGAAPRARGGDLQVEDCSGQGCSGCDYPEREFLAGEFSGLWRCIWEKKQAGCPVVGAAARLEKEKGLHVFLKAMRQLAEEFPEALFLIVGDGSQAEELRCLSRELGLGERVFFAGFQQEVGGWLALMDIVAVPSLSEAFGFSLLEAMALGKPCVASAVGGIKEIAEDGRTALLVSPGDAAALAEKAGCLLRSPAEAAALGRQAAAVVEQRFSARTMAEQMGAFYRLLLCGGAGV